MNCSNMMFSGEFIEFRRHTKGVDLEELSHLAITAVNSMAVKLGELEKWHTGLKEHPLHVMDFKVLTYNAMENGIINPSKFRSFLDCHEEETKLNDRSLFTFHGGVTRLIKENSLFRISDTSKNLKGFCDDYIELAKAA